MKKKVIESLLITLLLGALFTGATIGHIKREESVKEISFKEQAEKVYNMEELRNHLLAGVSSIAGKTDFTILEYEEYENTLSDDISVEESDVPVVESVDLSKIKEMKED